MGIIRKRTPSLKHDRYARDIKDKKTWDEIADRISRGLLAAIPLLQTEVIIFGGSIGTYFSHYSNRLGGYSSKTLTRTYTCPLSLKPTPLEEAVIYGCYYYAVDTL